jgi:hypothetical protein
MTGSINTIEEYRFIKTRIMDPPLFGMFGLDKYRRSSIDGNRYEYPEPDPYHRNGSRRGVLFANHLYSHFTYRHKSPKDSGYVNEQLFTPYWRIIPMHLSIIFGSIGIFAPEVFGITSTMSVLVLFLLIKTYSDITAHLIKHYHEENPDAPVQYL